MFLPEGQGGWRPVPAPNSTLGGCPQASPSPVQGYFQLLRGLVPTMELLYLAPGGPPPLLSMHAEGAPRLLPGEGQRVRRRGPTCACPGW